MFIQSFKFNRKIAVCILAVLALILIALILLAGSGDAPKPAGEKLPDCEARVEFLMSLGWEADPASEVAQEITLPETFSEVLNSYNQLQLQQGYDLTPYCGQNCILYTYTLTSYPNCNTEVVACLYLYKDRVIGGDIHSVAMDGFIHGLR